MTIRTTIEMKGLRALGERLRGLSSDVSGKVGQSATRAGAVVLKKRAAALAPKSEGEVTAHGWGTKPVKVPAGNLAKNIIVVKVPRSKLRLTAEYEVRIRSGEKAGYASLYGSFQEFGTVNMPAHPFLRPAFEEKKVAAVDAVQATIKRRINRAESKLAKQVLAESDAEGFE